jgi:hypothetical protein
MEGLPFLAPSRSPSRVYRSFSSTNVEMIEGFSSSLKPFFPSVFEADSEKRARTTARQRSGPTRLKVARAVIRCSSR